MRPAGRDGFTLVEALVAFAIVAAATLVMQRNLVQSRLAVSRASEREAAEWVARDLLAEPLSDPDMRDGGRAGVASGRAYEIRLSPIADDAAPADDRRHSSTEPEVRWQPMRVRISVQVDGSTPVTVETVKLGPVALPRPAVPSR